MAGVAIDEMRQNFGTVTATPSVVAGNLTETDFAYAFSGGTDTVTIPDSTSSSLTVADGVVGGATVECFVKFTAFPGSTKHIIWKSGSYALDITNDGHIQWTVQNGANSVTVTSATTINTGVWHHIVGVYNGGYLGVTQMGKNTLGASFTSLPGDYRAGALTNGNNLQVCRFQALERGTVSDITMSICIEASAPYSQDAAAVAYADASGLPGEKLAQSDGQYLASTAVGGPIPLSNAGRVWWAFPVSFTIYQGAFYWLGFAGGALHTSDTTVLDIGCDTSGGTRKMKNSVVSAGPAGPASESVDDPFGTPAASDAFNLDVYANYTATGRTGAEQKALIYIDGSLSNSSSYGHGIADSANTTQFAPTLAVQLNEVAIYDEALSPAQIAVHYASR